MKTNYFLSGKIIVLAAFLIGALSSISYAQPFQKGTNVISAGIGLGGHFGGYSTSSSTPGISLQFEHGNWEIGGPGVISLGGYLGYKSYKNEYAGLYNYNYSYKWNYTIIGLRSAYHYNGIESETWDVYGGLMLSYNILSFKYEDNDPLTNDNIYEGSYGSQVGLTAYVGGRYFFSDKVGAFAELGYGVAYLTLGVSFKL